MEKIPAQAGWHWVKEGFALFRKQPAELSTLFVAYMFLVLGISIIPFAGQVLPLILAPAFSLAFLQACANVEQDKRVYPNLLLTGFRSSAFRTLLILGVLYLLAAIAAIGASALVDGGMLWKLITGQIKLDEKTVQDTNLSMAMLFAAAVYTPAAMAFWHAAPLIAWQRMNLWKALFYSFFAVLRARKAFLLFVLSWLLVGVFAPAIVSTIAAALIGRVLASAFVLLPLTLMFTVVMYCSFYPTYTAIFGKPYGNGTEPAE